MKYQNIQIKNDAESFVTLLKLVILKFRIAITLNISNVF